MDSQAEKRYQ